MRIATALPLVRASACRVAAGAASATRTVAATPGSLARPLTIVVPEDADARDLAEGAAWFIGEERVALLPSRGVRWDSGLRPPPHLVGERARALDVLAAGGPRCASAVSP